MADYEGSIVRLMSERDLQTVLRWRNHPNVRRFMFTQHEIGIDEHRRWFENGRLREGRHLLIFEIDGEAQGFVQLDRLGDKGVADWGFYVSPDAPLGTGRSLATAALTHAFHELKMRKVCGQALGYNDVSIKFHIALGFVHEGILRSQHFDGHHYHDVVCFGLLRDEWKPQQKRVKS